MAIEAIEAIDAVEAIEVYLGLYRAIEGYRGYSCHRGYRGYRYYRHTLKDIQLTVIEDVKSEDAVRAFLINTAMRCQGGHTRLWTQGG